MLDEHYVMTVMTINIVCPADVSIASLKRIS